VSELVGTDDIATQADLFDGINALRRLVRVGWSPSGLVVEHDQVPIETIARDQLVLVDRRGDLLIYGLNDRPGWRLQIPASAPALLLEQLPQGSTYGGWIDRIGLVRATLLCGVLSAAVLAAVLTAPNWLGPLIPESWEQRIGTALVGDLEGYTCSTPASTAALASLVRDIDDGTTPVTVQLAKVDMVNAVALPGGRVLIFDKLIQDAKSADEVAGVLAHEIGHVRKRHVMQALLRQFGLSILLSGANSDLGSTLGGFAAMGYSRDAEREADRYSRGRLAAAHISPAGTAGFFGRLRKDDPFAGNKRLSYLNSHPDTAEREREFSAAVKSAEAYRPALTDAQFTALRDACAEDRDAKEWSLF